MFDKAMGFLFMPDYLLNSEEMHILSRASFETSLTALCAICKLLSVILDTYLVFDVSKLKV